MALTSKVVLGRPYKVRRVVHGWSCVVGLAFLGGSPGQVILGSRRGPEGQADSICKVPSILYTEAPGIQARAFLSFDSLARPTACGTCTEPLKGAKLGMMRKEALLSLIRKARCGKNAKQAPVNDTP